MVLCDEPTSALDPVTEASVQAVLDEAFANLTVPVNSVSSHLEL